MCMRKFKVCWVNIQITASAVKEKIPEILRSPWRRKKKWREKSEMFDRAQKKSRRGFELQEQTRRILWMERKIYKLFDVEN